MTAIIPSSLSPRIQQRMDVVQALLLEDKALKLARDKAIEYLSMPQEDTTSVLNALHLVQRFYFAGQLNLMDNPTVSGAIIHQDFPLWQDFASLDIPEEQQNQLALNLYKADLLQRTPILLSAEHYSRGIPERIIEQAMTEEVEIDFWVRDPHFQRRLLLSMDDAGITRFGKMMGIRHQGIGRQIVLTSHYPTTAFIDPPETLTQTRAFIQGWVGTRKELGTMEQMFTSFTAPTPQDAVIDGFDDYHHYTKKALLMSLGPDEEKVDREQRILIYAFNAASIVRLTNDDGTDLIMSIEGMTFAHSMTARNNPGSEFFSSPVTGTLNGKMVAKGRFIPENHPPEHLVEDIEIDFENGVAVRWKAARGQEYLDAMLDTDDGARRVGELGVGTNIYGDWESVILAYAEKRRGTVHLAMGRAYEMTDYLGEPVNVDNGNRSQIHWDIPITLFGRNGKIMLDGKTVYENDKWTIPGIEYLNGPA